MKLLRFPALVGCLAFAATMTLTVSSGSSLAAEKTSGTTNGCKDNCCSKTSKKTRKDSHGTPEKVGRDAPRDMNIFQVEPTVIDEKYYVSGRSERHQKTSPTLPYGAEIPDRGTEPAVASSVKKNPAGSDNAPASSKSKEDEGKDGSLKSLSESRSKMDKKLLEKVSSMKKDAYVLVDVRTKMLSEPTLAAIRAVPGLEIKTTSRLQNAVTVKVPVSSVDEIVKIKDVQKVLWSGR